MRFYKRALISAYERMCVGGAYQITFVPPWNVAERASAEYAPKVFTQELYNDGLLIRRIK